MPIEKNAGIANTKIRPMLSIFSNTFGIPSLNWAGVKAFGSKVIRLRLKSRGGKVSQMPFLMMSVFVIIIIVSLHAHWIQNLVRDSLSAQADAFAEANALRTRTERLRQRIDELFCLIQYPLIWIGDSLLNLTQILS